MEDQPKIIQGNFGPRPQAGNPDPANPKQPSPPTFAPGAPRPFGVVLDPATGKEVPLSIAQQKAISIILMHKPFVMIALEPTETGCDFYRAVHGEETDLQNAAPHLHAQLDKALTGAGVIT